MTGRVDETPQKHRQELARVEMVFRPGFDLACLDAEKVRNVPANGDSSLRLALLRAVGRRLHVEELLAVRPERLFQAHSHVRRQRRVAIEKIGEGRPANAEPVRGLFDRHPGRDDVLPDVFADGEVGI